eukprot:1555901-Rhodomonas_salina.2
MDKLHMNSNGEEGGSSFSTGTSKAGSADGAEQVFVGNNKAIENRATINLMLMQWIDAPKTVLIVEKSDDTPRGRVPPKTLRLAMSGADLGPAKPSRRRGGVRQAAESQERDGDRAHLAPLPRESALEHLLFRPPPPRSPAPELPQSRSVGRAESKTFNQPCSMDFTEISADCL